MVEFLPYAKPIIESKEILETKIHEFPPCQNLQLNVYIIGCGVGSCVHGQTGALTQPTQIDL